MSFLTTGNRSESGYSLNPAMYEALSISEPDLNSGVVKAVRIGYHHCFDIQGSGFFQTTEFLLTHPVAFYLRPTGRYDRYCDIPSS